MDEFDGILAMLNAADGKISGRTTIQKLGYFSTVRGAIKARYRPHYYGPYSAEIAGAIQALVSYGFIEERVEIQESPGHTSSLYMRRYTYTLTDDGRGLIQKLKEEHGPEIKEIEDIINICKKTANLDSRILSWAAKVHYIQTLEKRDLSHDEIQEIARTLSWDISDEQIRKGLDLLGDLRISGG